MKCNMDSEIQHEIIRDTTRKLEKHKLICVVSQTISCTVVSRNPSYISFPFKQCTLCWPITLMFSLTLGGETSVGVEIPYSGFTPDWVISRSSWE